MGRRRAGLGDGMKNSVVGGWEEGGLGKGMRRRMAG